MRAQVQLHLNLICYTDVVYKEVAYPPERFAQDEYKYIITSGG
jgi:hypothetical protein